MRRLPRWQPPARFSGRRRPCAREARSSRGARWTLPAIPGPGEGFVLICPFYSDFMIRHPRWKRSGLVGPAGRGLAAGLEGSDSWLGKTTTDDERDAGPAPEAT